MDTNKLTCKILKNMWFISLSWAPLLYLLYFYDKIIQGRRGGPLRFETDDQNELFGVFYLIKKFFSKPKLSLVEGQHLHVIPLLYLHANFNRFIYFLKLQNIVSYSFWAITYHPYLKLWKYIWGPDWHKIIPPVRRGGHGRYPRASASGLNGSTRLV